jgi:hypothetical protein
VNDTDQALHALLRLQKRLIGRGSGASCCTDAKIVKIREDFKTIKDTLANLAAERDEARRSCCEFAAMVDSADTVVMYVDSNRFHEIAMRYMKSRGWDCFKEDGK